MDQNSRKRARSLSRKMKLFIFLIMVAKGIYFLVRLIERLLDFLK